MEAAWSKYHYRMKDLLFLKPWDGYQVIVLQIVRRLDTAKVAGNITIHSTDSRYGPATHQVSPRAAKPHAGSSTPFCPLK